ncbi:MULTISPECIES: hypothetical protein, partial [unclassified Roseobacter]|uniref:hypothetical protein n=1 Tax=unclassified Roseobacter TaxID=196798 RepID=UPI001C0ECD48
RKGSAQQALTATISTEKKQERILHLSGPDQGAGSRRCIVGHFCRLEVTDYYSLIEVFEFKHLAWPQLSIDCN